MECAEPRDARSYVVGALRLLAEAAGAAGARDEAEAHLERGASLLHDWPAPLIAWKVFASMGAGRAAAGRHADARAAFTEAASNVRLIAAHVDDPALRETFLGSARVRDVLGHPGVDAGSARS
jgi:hypothetical protein